MNAAYRIFFRGVELRVELNDDGGVESIAAGGEEILPLFSDLLIADIQSAVFDSMCDEAERRTEAA